MKEIQVIKRDGVSEPLNLDKIHVMVERACNGLAGVSESQVEMNANLQFFDGIKTSDIQEILIRSANDLISLDAPNYQFVAARLLLFGLRKAVYNGHPDGHPPLLEHVEKCVSRKIYDASILKKYTEQEWEKLSGYMDHERDYLFTYAGVRQVVDKYLVQDRSTGNLFETPQYMYMMIAATLFQDDDKFYRLEYVRKYYDAISKHRLNIPTPIMAGVRTPLRQFASCVLVDVDDTLDSIFSSDMAIGKYVAQRAGIGINAGRIRGINAKIRGGEVQHTGVIPFLKKFESTVRCCTQNGIRGGSATVHFPIWHQEIEDIIVLKNNKGTEDNRVRKLDYSIQISKLFYERFIADGEISLFSPHDVPGLYDAFGTDDFDTLYRMHELNDAVPRKTIGAQELFLNLLKERAETGRLYIMNIDHCNSHSSFKDKVNMSNLCQEITLPTDPISHIDDPKGEIALCILSAINVGKLKNLDELDELCDLAVRGLDALIDYQEYPVEAAKQSTINRRSLGVGYIGLAHYLARHGASYDSTKAHDLVHKLTERFQFALLSASNSLSMEKGPCGYFGKTKYADGILPIDTYKNDVDEIVPNDLQCDWEFLRGRIKQYGLRNSTLSAQMPSESSSVVSNATNGIEPPRGYLSVKKSKKGPLKQIVPQYSTLKNAYTLLWDMPNNDGYIKIAAVMQKFFDQAISGNWSYNPEMYPDNEVPVSVMAKDLLTTYKYGWKTSYYQNTYDNKKDGDEEPAPESVDNLINELLESEEEDCESCKI
ncbi:ribonucleotide reductase of class Ia (aerobic) alpha subunit [Cyanophage S-RIM12 isolate W1_08_0910]|uniref:Ribonucleoside-diphosphate reductase n=4 Tax=Brizovirus TaxID=2733098 RepID=A0A1D7SP60_9CAUD|nr:ribonucleotide reductase large subunit [Cyanophage S-RIM12 isolate RW_06_0310]YP_009779587.1 ribonucleotide reductase large subunit [Cyanophage S-RIM12 isolate W1_08_0910]AOO15450.1 ribonucleotide reductase of class Ia (aerobic) alpha subunit [Cyanophage S-RIM12_Np_15_0310]AOO16090.1 ribonucleotide reductase of class Ia (aerobic) alpha subunit [Cyanophage S-RIM12_RW_04_0310]AOO19523.1 ribonucleotide reductase of class Ia (aerobic) alpha subunit [Cyanophage S-RIM12_WH_07_0310]AOO16520.1 ribo